MDQLATLLTDPAYYQILLQESQHIQDTLASQVAFSPSHTNIVLRSLSYVVDHANDTWFNGKEMAKRVSKWWKDEETHMGIEYVWYGNLRDLDHSTDSRCNEVLIQLIEAFAKVHKILFGPEFGANGERRIMAPKSRGSG